LASLSLLLAPVYASPSPAPEPDEDITVVVTAERVAQPVTESIATTTIVTADDIRQQGAVTVADALRTVPGVSIRQNGQVGALAVPAIRGTLPSQTLVLVNGQRMSSAAFIGGVDLAKYPVVDIERIEVIRGPVSSLYGSEAIGGVINIITQRPTENSGMATFGYGSHGHMERSLLVNGVASAFDWQFAGAFPAFDGRRPNSAYEATNLSGSLHVPAIAGWDVTVRGEHYHDTLGLPGADYADTGMSDPDDRMAWERTQGSLAATRNLGPGEVRLGISRLRQILENTSPGLDWTTGNPTTSLSHVTGDTDSYELTYTLQGGAHRWTVGGEYRQEEYRNTERQDGAIQSTQDTNESTRAVYLQDRWALASSTDLVAGLRYDDYTQAGSRVSPRVGVYHQLTPALALRASYGEGFRAPSLVERYYNAFGLSGNPNLRPETSRQYEIGANWLLARGSLDVALFRNQVEDQIAWEGMTYENVNHARQQGLEVAWTSRLRTDTALTLSYTYLDAINETTGDRLLRVPHNQLSLTATQPWRAWEVALTGTWIDARSDYGGYDPVTFQSITTALPTRTSLDLTITHTGMRGVRPYVILRNLMNETTPELAGYPVEGRSLEGGMRVNW
jgi:outer membrane cobalamin receptor